MSVLFLDRVSLTAYINVEKTMEVFGWVWNELLAIRTKDSPVAVPLLWFFEWMSSWGVELDSRSSDGLEWGEGECSSLDCISRGYELFSG